MPAVAVATEIFSGAKATRRYIYIYINYTSGNSNSLPYIGLERKDAGSLRAAQVGGPETAA